MSEWHPIETAPESDRFPAQHVVDLWVRAEHSGAEFRAADCYLRNGLWFQTESMPLKIKGWTPLYWMPIPEEPDGHETA